MNILSRLETWGQWLTQDPGGFLIYLVYLVATVLLALTIHEFAHGYVAYKCGDPTAKNMGRLTLNPIKHLDPIGTPMLFLFGFGYAKAVPVNPRNFRNYRRDDFLVSIAGIVTNLLACLLCLSLAYFLNRFLWEPEVVAQLGNRYLISTDGIGSWLVYGYGPPSEGLGEYMEYLTGFMKTPWLLYVQRFLLQFAWLNMGLAIFNILPIPPLDGYHLFNDVFFKGRLQLSRNAFQIAMVAVVVLMSTGVLDTALSFLRDHLESGILWLISAIAGGG